MRSAIYQDEPEQEGSTSFTLIVILAACLVVAAIALILFFVLGSDGGIIQDPFSRFPVQPQ